jgi:hypothetical protein
VRNHLKQADVELAVGQTPPGVRLAGTRILLGTVIALAWSSPALLAQSGPASGGQAVTSRQISAIRMSGVIVVDGHLDDNDWRVAEAATDFIQQEPAEGSPATRRTEVRFAYDGETLYVGAKLYDDRPERAITDELNRDFNERGGDLFGIVLDTFLDGRSSYGFLTNPSGAQREVQAFDNGQKSDPNWNGAWFVRTAIQHDSWSVEAAIPFKTLRFPDRAAQRWGLNIVRIVRRVNEVTMWAPVPRPLTPYHVGYAGVLTGVEGVRPGHHLRLIPFTTVQADRSRSGVPWHRDADGGVDLKWSVTPSFVLDGTFRTDFAQVEADEQQINLTRFSQLFPEKRQFFLEAPTSFQIGLASEETGAVATALIPFFTRRIGLSESGVPIPVLGGARLTGQSGGTTVGLLTMQTSGNGGRPGDNFTAVRLAHDVGRGVTLGTFYFGRESGGDGVTPLGSYNRVVGADVRLSPTRILDVEAFLMGGFSDGPEDDTARRVRARLRGNRKRASFDYLHIGDQFRHDLGFVRRRGIAMFYGDYAEVFRPRATERWAREHTLQVETQTLLNPGYDYVLTNQDRGIYALGLADGGAFRVIFEHNYERAVEPFSLRGVSIPAGVYEFNELVLNYSTDRSRRLSASVQRNHGDFWNGTRRRIKSSVRLRLNAHLAASFDYQREAIRLGSGGFVAELAGLRADWSLTTRTFLNAFLQYDGAQKAWFSNVRFNFIHRPLSDVYIVWNEGRGSGSGDSRALILKYTHLVEF